MLINYSLRLHRQKNPRALNEILALYDLGLRNDFFIWDGQLSEMTFQNMVISACLLKDFSLANDLIVKNKKFLNPKIKTFTVNLCLAYIAFHEQKYERAYNIISKQENEAANITHRVMCKVLELRSLYELFLYQPKRLHKLLYKFESLLAFLNYNRELPKNRKKAYRNLVLFLKRIVRAQIREHVSDRFLNKFKKEITDCKSLYAAPWLLEKLSQLNHQ